MFAFHLSTIWIPKQSHMNDVCQTHVDLEKINYFFQNNSLSNNLPTGGWVLNTSIVVKAFRATFTFKQWLNY